MSRLSFASKTVLVVDDFDPLRKMLHEFLESLGMEVLEASNGADAIHIVRSYPDSIDLLITDIEMPGMSGLESAKEIAALKSGLRILLMSAGMSRQERQEYDEKLPGMYFGTGSVVKLDSETNKGFITPHACLSAEPAKKTVLVFRRVGDEYFLYRIWTAGNTAGRELPAPKRETQLARNGEKSEEIIVAANITK
jgi:CheY-like chemotaxis protein